MRLIFLLFVSILLSNAAYTQEVSKHLSINNEVYYDEGKQCIPLSDGFIILFHTNVPDSNGTSKSSIGLLRLDNSLNPVWSKSYHNYSSDRYGMHATGTVMEIIGDTIYVAAFARSFLGMEIRMLAISLVDGTLLNEKEIHPGDYPRMLFDDMLEKDGHLILYTSLGFGDPGEEFLHFIKLDLQFNVIQEYGFGDNYQTFLSYDLKSLDEGGYVLVYGEEHTRGTCSLKVARLDDQFNVVSTNELPYTELGLSINSYKSSIHPTKDGGFFLYWHRDFWDSIPHPYPYRTSPFPPVVYKLDSLFNVEWEYVFVSTYEKGAMHTKLDSEGNLLSAGFSMSFYSREYFKDPSHKSDGWTFLMSPSGELLWERSIADSVFHSYGGKFQDVTETDEGFLYVGHLQLVIPTGMPYPRDTDIWLLTLDKDGCWNDNCNPYIVINGDSTSSTNTKETALPQASILAYPNPTNSVLNIECEECSTNSLRKIEVFSVDGSKVMEVDLFAPKSTLNLSNLTNGTYFLVHSMNGRAIETHKIIVGQ